MKRLLLILCILILSSAAQATGKDKIIYIKQFSLIEGIPSNSPLGTRIKDYICEVILGEKGYVIVSDEEVAKSLAHEEIRMSMDSCYDDACMKKMMEKIDADYLLYGTLSRENGNYVLTAKLLDRKTGTLSKIKTIEISDETMLKMASKDIGRYLAYGTEFDESKYVSSKKVTRNLSISEQRINGVKAMGFSAFLPGFGQMIYGGTWGKVEGVLLFGGTALLGYLTYDSYNKKNSALNSYKNIGNGSPQSAFDSKWSASKSAQTKYNMFAASLAAVYLLNIADAYFSGSRVDTVELSSNVSMPLKSGFRLALSDGTGQSYFGASYRFTF